MRGYRPRVSWLWARRLPVVDGSWTGAGPAAERPRCFLGRRGAPGVGASVPTAAASAPPARPEGTPGPAGRWPAGEGRWPESLPSLDRSEFRRRQAAHLGASAPSAPCRSLRATEPPAGSGPRPHSLGSLRGPSPRPGTLEACLLHQAENVSGGKGAPLSTNQSKPPTAQLLREFTGDAHPGPGGQPRPPGRASVAVLE